MTDETARADAECPGPNCSLCSGEACLFCGAGCWDSSVRDCQHDAIERHRLPGPRPAPAAPATTPTPEATACATCGTRWPTDEHRRLCSRSVLTANCDTDPKTAPATTGAPPRCDYDVIEALYLRDQTDDSFRHALDTAFAQGLASSRAEVASLRRERDEARAQFAREVGAVTREVYARDASESRCRALSEALRELVDGRCWEHEDACCVEWCRMCQREVRAVAAARVALASHGAGGAAPPCGGSRCHRSDDGTWIHSSKSYGSCSVQAGGCEDQRSAKGESP